MTCIEKLHIQALGLRCIHCLQRHRLGITTARAEGDAILISLAATSHGCLTIIWLGAMPYKSKDGHMSSLCVPDIIVCLCFCRAIADYEAPTISVTVPAATAQQYGNTSIVVSSQSDTAEVVLADRTAALDLTFSTTPLQPAVAGAYLGAAVTAKCSVVLWSVAGGGTPLGNQQHHATITLTASSGSQKSCQTRVCFVLWCRGGT
jgi:hypothetical protein